MHPAFLYLPGDRLSLPELSAARLDGHVIDLGDAYIPADLVEGPGVRAASLGPLLRTGTAIAGPSAAWVHGAGDAPPSPHHLRRAVARRVRPVMSTRVRYHDTPIPDDDLMLLGGVAVTTFARTLVDLALGAHRDHALVPWLHDLAAIDREALRDALARLHTLHRVPGSRTATRLLETIVRRM